MVSSVGSVPGFVPTTYLSQLKGAKPLTAVANTAPVPTATTKPATSSTQDTSKTTPNNLLGLSSDVLSLLQGNSSSSSYGSQISGLLSSSNTTSSDPSAGLYGTLLAQKSSTLPTQTAVQITEAHQAQAATNNSPVQSLVTNYNATRNATNATLLQNAQNLLKQGANLLA